MYSTLYSTIYFISSAHDAVFGFDTFRDSVENLTERV